MRALPAFLIASAILTAASPVKAEEPWTVRTTLYGWLTSINGSATIGRLKTDIDASFSDTLKEMDSLVALMSYTEARHDRWGFYLDLVWMDVGFTQSSARLAEPIEGLSFTLDKNTGLGTQIGLAEAGIAYELKHWDGGSGAQSGLDGLIGMRGAYVGLDLSFDVEGTVDVEALGLELSGTRARSRSANMAWMDPIVGVRFRHQFAGGDRIQVRGDVGGFGLGSNFSWQLIGTYSYDFDDGAMSAVLGYRALGIDYGESSGLAKRNLDLIIHGPVVGFTFRW